MKKLTLLTIALAVFMYSCKNAAFYSQKGDQYFAEGNYETAIQNYQQALEKGASKGETNFQIGESYRLSNRLSSAGEYYKDAMGSGVKDKPAAFHYGMSLKSKGSYDEAKKVLDEYAKKSKDKEYLKLAKYESKKIAKIQQLTDPKWDFKIETNQKLNSNAEDYAPVKMGDKLVFASSRGEGQLYGGSGFGFSDLYVMDSNGSISKMDESGTINTSDRHEASATFTPDGKIMVFARSNKGEKNEESSDVDLYMSTKDNSGNWGEPTRLSINTADKWEGSPAFSSDGKKLYFASDRKGGKGGLDLWESTHKNGRFSKPKNMGSNYNTFGNEMFPFSNTNGEFYFSSDGHVGYGGLDIFRVENGEKPVNLGKKINTTSDDFGLVFVSEKEGYFCSNREGGLGGDDIYRFEKEIVNRYFLDLEVKGRTEEKEFVIGNAGITFVEDGRDGESNFTNDIGHYRHELHENGHYEIRVEKDSFFTKKVVFNLNKTEIEKKGENKNGEYTIKEYVVLDKIEDKPIEMISLNLLYDLNKWDIRPDAAKELDRLDKFLNDNPGIRVELGSHTDSRGSDESNMILSTKRAESAVNYIVEKGGISKTRIVAKGYGETQILNRCAEGVTCTEDEHQANRRTEIKVLGVEDLNRKKHEEYEKRKEAERLEREREERHEQLEEEYLLIEDLRAEVKELEGKNLKEGDEKYEEYMTKKGRLEAIEKHFSELETQEKKDKEMNMKEKFDEMEKKMEEVEEKIEE